MIIKHTLSYLERRKCPWFILLLLLPFISLARDNDQPEPFTYPDLEEIANVFAQNFELNTYRNENFYRFNFIRDPNGWHVLPLYFSHKNENPILIWSATDYYPSNIDPGKNSKEVFITELISNRDLYDFTTHPFYGYQGWTDDVIIHLENKETAILSDNELYGLARAYAQKASDILWSHSHYSDPSQARGTQAERRDAKLYLEYAENSLRYLHILYERSPGYRTLIGLMDLKYANEVMNHYFELNIFGFRREAEKLLEEHNVQHLYQPFWEKYAREILSPLKKNGILFTNGDNDTYPLLWMQEIKNFRQDIRIINLSLLSDPLYYHLITDDSNLDNKLESSFTKEQIFLLEKKTILIDDNAPRSLSFDRESSFVTEELRGDNPVITIPNGDYNIDYLTGEGLFDTLRLSSGNRGNVQSTSEFLVRSIINAQIGKRPLYFSKGMQPRFKSMIDVNHLIDKGLYYCIEKKNHQAVLFENNYFDTGALNTLIRKTTLEIPDTEYFSRVIIFNLILEASFIQIYHNESMGNHDKTDELIIDFINKYPPESTGINYYYLFLIDNLYTTDKSDLAKEAFRRYFEELKENILKTQISDEDPYDIQTLKYYQSILSLVRFSAFMENNDSLKEEIYFLEETIKKRLLEFPEINID